MKKMKKLKETMIIAQKPTVSYRTSAPTNLRVVVHAESPQCSEVTENTACSLS